MKLCNLDTAQALQELGFGYDLREVTYTHGYFKGYGDKSIRLYREETDQFIPAPRLDDAAYWLREHYKILITIDYVWYDGYQYSISQNFAKKRPNVVLSVGYDTYDSALEAAVNKAIEIIKSLKL